MIYENFEMNYEKLVFQTGFSASSNHRHSTVQDVLNDIERFWHISNFALPDLIVESYERIIKIMREVSEHYSKKNFALDEIYLFNIKDKEFFDIVELTHNFLIPLSIKYIINEQISSQCLHSSISPAFVAAEVKILLSKEKILSGNSTKIDAMDYKFNNFVFKNFTEADRYFTDTNNTNVTPVSKLRNISSFKKENIESNNESNRSRGREKPRSPQDIILNKIEN